MDSSGFWQVRVTMDCPLANLKDGIISASINNGNVDEYLKQRQLHRGSIHMPNSIYDGRGSIFLRSSFTRYDVGKDYR